MLCEEIFNLFDVEYVGESVANNFMLPWYQNNLMPRK
jgi:hypothetical protein